MTSDPEIQFYWIDLKKGLEASLLAKEVEETRKFFNSKAAQLKELSLDEFRW